VRAAAAITLVGYARDDVEKALGKNRKACGEPSFYLSGVSVQWGKCAGPFPMGRGL